MNENNITEFSKSISENIIEDLEIQHFPPSSYPNKNNYLELDDAQIYYEVYGEGPAIIFIHGLGGNHLSWWQQIPYFSNRYKCVNFSHRGFANSKNYSNKIGHEVFAEDLNALIEHLKLDEVYLVAQSMGGWTSITYALNNPEKVKGIVLASTSGTIDFKQINHPEIERIHLWEEWSKKEMELLKNNNVLNAIGFEMAKTQPELSFVYEQIYNLTPYSYKEMIRTDIKANRIKSPELLQNLKIPFLFLTGEHDVSFPPAGASALTSILENSELISFKNSGHSVYFERPAEFNIAVDEFVSRISGIPTKSAK